MLEIDVLPPSADMVAARQAMKNARNVLGLCQAIMLRYLASHSKEHNGEWRPCECDVCQDARTLL